MTESTTIPSSKPAGFSVEQQLIGKLGKAGYGALLDNMMKRTRKESK